MTGTLLFALDWESFILMRFLMVKKKYSKIKKGYGAEKLDFE